MTEKSNDYRDGVSLACIIDKERDKVVFWEILPDREAENFFDEGDNSKYDSLVIPLSDEQVPEMIFRERGWI